MRLQTVPARQGVLWTRRGLRTFAARPMAFALLFASVMCVVVLLNVAPLLAVVVVPVVPLMSLGFMIATRRVLDGGLPTPRVFVEPLQVDRPRRIAHLKLGLVYMAATFAIMGMVALIDGGDPEALLESLPANTSAVDAPEAASAASAADAASAPDAAAVLAASPGALIALLLRFALAGALAIPFWHAPALVHWGGQGWAQALFSSTLACWRNRGAFALYLFAWFAIVSGCGLLGSVLLKLLGQPQMMMGTIVPMSLIIVTMFYASLYFTFTDCFVAGDGEALPATPTPRSPPEERS